MKITQKFTSLAAAVAASAIDLSYNESSARQDIAIIDRNCREAFLMEDGTIQYVFDAGRHGRMLNKFSPFHSVLCDSPLRPAYIDGNEIKFVERFVSKSNTAARKAITDMGLLLA